MLVPMLLAALSAMPARALGDSANEAATHAYVSALYTWTQSVVASLPSSTMAFEGRASQISDECHGILAGAPSFEQDLLARRSPSARQRGELALEARQASELDRELDFVLISAWIQPDRQAALAFTGVVAPLQWSDPAITQAAQLSIAGLQERLALVPPNVCADLRAWVASGYKTLPAATKAFLDQRRAMIRQAATARPLQPLLAPYEDARDRSLIAKVKRLSHREVDSLNEIGRALTSLQLALGEPAPKDHPVARPAKGSVVAHGRTAAGGGYTVLVKPQKRHAGAAPQGCEVSVRITSSQGESSEECDSAAGAPSRASVNCDAGLLTIRAETLTRARTVVLHLSDGRRIASRVAIVPARLGGPVGLYYQVVRGPSPIPVSLAELDAHGRTLRVLSLPRVVECTRHPLKVLAGGIRTLVSDSVPPQGPAFTINAERYRFLGHTYFTLKLRIAPESESEFGFQGTSTIAVGRLGGQRSPFSAQFESGCHPHPYEIVYGLLTAPSDTVLARAASGTLYPLRQVSIPASLHAGGVLVYTALSVAPTELLIRDPTGKTVATETLHGLTTEAFETCEGEAEPPN